MKWFVAVSEFVVWGEVAHARIDAVNMRREVAIWSNDGGRCASVIVALLLRLWIDRNACIFVVEYELVDICCEEERAVFKDSMVGMIYRIAHVYPNEENNQKFKWAQSEKTQVIDRSNTSFLCIDVPILLDAMHTE